MCFKCMFKFFLFKKYFSKMEQLLHVFMLPLSIYKIYLYNVKAKERELCPLELSSDG